MALTGLEIKRAKPRDKPYKLSDGDNMFLWVNLGRRKTLALGLPLRR
jgi:hypothetical protein